MAVQGSEEYMRRAAALARRGIGHVNPNPLVGAVIVKDGRIIGEGYHAFYGGLHAERAAFESLTESAEGACMYVTLEPCCHHGKQPPCTDAIIEHKISKVFVGSDDPNKFVAGKGIEILRNAGIEVETGVLKDECDALNPVFFHYITTGMPYVVMKYAMTLDGKIACETGESRWVTGEEARHNVHKMRGMLSGIMAGINTVIADNPSLTCRIEGGRNPVRIICDTNLRIPLECDIVCTALDIKTIVASVPAEDDEERKIKRKQLEEAGIEIIDTAAKDGRVDLRDLMVKLGERSIDGILLEGGAMLNESALKAGIVSRIQTYIAPKIFGGSGKYTPVRGEGVPFPKDAYICKNIKTHRFGEDIMIESELE